MNNSKKEGHWTVKNELSFSVRAIDVTGNKDDPTKTNFDVDPLAYYIDHVFEKKSTMTAVSPAIKDGVDYEIIMSRNSDAYPITMIYPELKDESNDVDDTIISKEMLADSEECLNLIKEYLSGKMSKLTAGLHSLLSNTADTLQTKDFYKQVATFVKDNYENAKLKGSLPDNITMIESYLYNFPNHWLANQKKFYLYRAAYKDIKGSADIPLTQYGSIKIESPDASVSCNLQKGKNGGYKVELNTITKGNHLVEYLNGSFVLGTRVNLKPFFVTKKLVYNGLHLKTKSGSKLYSEDGKGSDIVVVMLGTILDDIVIAIPDEVDLQKQNTSSAGGTPSTPSWGYIPLFAGLALALIATLGFLRLWARKRGYLKGASLKRLGFLGLKKRNEAYQRITNNDDPDINSADFLKLCISEKENNRSTHDQWVLEVYRYADQMVNDDKYPENLQKFFDDYPEHKQEIVKWIDDYRHPGSITTPSTSSITEEVLSFSYTELAQKLNFNNKVLEYIKNANPTLVQTASFNIRVHNFKLAIQLKTLQLSLELSTMQGLSGVNLVDSNIKIIEDLKDILLKIDNNVLELNDIDDPTGLLEAYSNFDELNRALKSRLDSFTKKYSSLVEGLSSEITTGESFEPNHVQIQSLKESIVELCRTFGNDNLEEMKTVHEE